MTSSLLLFFIFFTTAEPLKSKPRAARGLQGHLGQRWTEGGREAPVVPSLPALRPSDPPPPSPRTMDLPLQPGEPWKVEVHGCCLDFGCVISQCLCLLLNKLDDVDALLL